MSESKISRAGFAGPLKRALVNCLLAAGSCILVAALIEIAFQAFPALLPSGTYGSGHFHESLHSTVHAGRSIYRRGLLVLREPSSEGFLDIEHLKEKPSGVARIGFFGDSFVEAMQVPLESTFFRQLSGRRQGPQLEALAFGISGWGTLHAFLAYEHLASRYQIDIICYVFVENDPGDNLYSLQKRHQPSLGAKASARLIAASPGFEVVKIPRSGRQSFWFKIAKAIQRRSLLAQLAWSRLHLLRDHGVAASTKRKAVAMAEPAVDRVPRAAHLPVSWPAQYRNEAEMLAQRILEHWRQQAEAEQDYFFVLYVPRGEAQLTGDLDIEATWFPWLQRTCAELGIPLVDPSECLARRLWDGDHVYRDHWTPAGHQEVAQLLLEHLSARLGEGSAPG